MWCLAVWAAAESMGMGNDPHKMLAAGVGLSTTIDGDDVEISFSLPSQGWIAFGLGGNGGMRGADIVLVRSINGVFTVQDMWADDYARPQIDQAQNVWLRSASRNATHTSAVVARRLAACDPTTDRPIVPGEPVYFLWAWGTTDTFSKHEAHSRGSRRIILVDRPPPPLAAPKAARQSFLATSPEDTPPADQGRVVLEARMPADTDLPNGDWYRCVAWEVPKALRDAGAGGVTWLLGGFPRVESHLVHHMIIFGCDDATDAPPSNGTWTCFGSAGPRCQAFYSAWAPGSAGSWAPEGSAYRLYRWVALQIHYSNAGGEVGQRDNSGMALHITPIRRPIVAAVGVTGVPHDSGVIAIPPRMKSTTIKAVCPAGSLASSPAMPAGGILIHDVMLHAHTRGRELRLEVARQGQMIPLLVEPHYDFNHQSAVRLPQPFRLLPGDVVHTTCVYDTSADSAWVMGGEATTQEMCYVFFTYTPEVVPGDLLACVSLRTHPAPPSSTPAPPGGGGALGMLAAVLGTGAMVTISNVPLLSGGISMGGFNATLVSAADLAEPPRPMPAMPPPEVVAACDVSRASWMLVQGGGWPKEAVAAVVVLAVATGVMMVVVVATIIFMGRRAGADAATPAGGKQP